MAQRRACYKRDRWRQNQRFSLQLVPGSSMSRYVPQDHADHEETLNAADYVDELLRPKSQRLVVLQEKIKGRRLRDRYLEEILVSKIVEQ